MKNISVKFAGVFAVVAFALTATSASAQTAAELQAMIAQLQAQIASMSGGSTAPVASTTFTRDLTLGSTGADVVALQTWLESKGFLTIPAGTSKGYFGELTRAALAKYQMSAGISPAAGYFGPATRAKIAMTGGSTTPSTPSTGLKGGAGDIESIDDTTSGTETTLGEGKTENVVGFDIEADDNSDLAITSIKLDITTADGESTRLTRYLEEVAIVVDGDEVGTVDASDFSRNGSVSTATISLDDAVVEAGEEVRFYVALTAADSINDSELGADMLEVEVSRIRFEDASGAILTADVNTSTEIVPVSVDLEDATENDDAKVKSSSDTKEAGLLKVEDNNTSDEYNIFTFEFDIDEDSSDLVVLEIPVDLAIVNSTSTDLVVEDMIKDLWLEIDGEMYDDFDFEVDTTVDTSETVTVTFTIDEGDLEIAAGDVVEASLFVEFNEQDGNYSDGVSIEASVDGSDITAENAEGDVFVLDGSATGETQTVQLSAATIDDFRWSVNNTGTIIDFFFTVTAEDEDFDVLAASIDDTIDDTATTSAATLTRSTGDADAISGGFRVLDGDTATFRVRYTLTGSNGQYSEVTIESVAGQEVPDDKQVSPTATINTN